MMTGAAYTEPARLGIGTVRHKRLRPSAHAFAYPTYFLMLPLRRMQHEGSGSLARNRFSPISFFDRDHGDGRADCLQWITELLAAEGINNAHGEVWLHCYPRVLGFTFKPVSFWYCHRSDGTLAAIVVEVNNTFGERHCYVLGADSGGEDDGGRLRFGRELQARKVFHVSPFCNVSGQYRFRFLRTDVDDPQGCGRTVVRIEHDDERSDTEGPLIVTSISGELAPATRARIRHALLGVPLMTFGVVARIHWQALRLWIKRVPFVQKPAPPDRFVTRPNS
jgi:uncharacterized protein